MTIDITPPQLAIPGRGLDGFFSVAKHSITTLVNIMVAIITQSSKVTSLPPMTPSKVNEIGKINYLSSTLETAKKQPQQMFKKPIQAITAIDEEPIIVSIRNAAKQFETYASHNTFILIVSIVIMGYLIFSHRDILLIK
jgi:hypothetical protein